MASNRTQRKGADNNNKSKFDPLVMNVSEPVGLPCGPPELQSRCSVSVDTAMLPSSVSIGSKVRDMSRDSTLSETVPTSNNIKLAPIVDRTWPATVQGWIPTNTTQPNVQLRHNISDDELQVLKECNRNGLSEAFWAFTAGALTAIPASFAAIFKSFVHVPSEPLSLLHLIEILIFFGCFALALCLHVISTNRSKQARVLIDDIRSRTDKNTR